VPNRSGHTGSEIFLQMKSAGSVMAAPKAFQPDSSGSIPTPALQNYLFSIAFKEDVVPFIAKYHYTHSMSGVQYKYAFAAIDDNWEMVGAAVFGQTAMPTTWKRYAKSADELIELRRLVFTDNTPRNIESRFIGWCLRWLRNETDFKYVLSYADPYYGHQGTIYKASNFQFMGVTAKSRMILWNGKLRHSKSLQAGRKTEIRPYSFKIREALLSGEASYVTRPGKNIYLYKLR
jgi:hypothetical protein